MASNRDEPLSFINPSTSSPVAVSEGDSYLLDHSGNSQIGSASGSFQNEGFLGGVDGGSSGSDAEFGFSRVDFRQSALVGTVQYYDRHVFLCYKNPKVWPPRIEAAEFDRLPRLLSAALAARKGDIRRQTCLTICEGHDGTETSNGDVLIFPDMIRYRRLTHFDVDTFVEEVLVKDGEWVHGSPEPLKGWYIFVCSHGSRDRRCGTCGPAVITRLREEIELRGLNNKIYVSACSHISGHKYAGNVIIFGSNMSGDVTGHWYGYVMPDDVPSLLEQHVLKGEIVDHLWRGQMGLSEDDQKKSQELRLQLNSNCGRIDEKSGEESRETNGVSCCQTYETSSPCCQDPILPEKAAQNPNLIQEAEEFTGEKKRSKKQSLQNNRRSKGGKVCSNFDNWEREDTYAVLAVVGAAVSVALVFSCYKQLR